MKNIILLSIAIIFTLTTCNQNKNVHGEIEIEWTDKLSADFSFTEKWSYPEGIYENEFGQLICDGFCPPEVAGMYDDIGRIKEDSLNRYYRLVDTTHQHHTIESDAWTYEWAGTDFITANRVDHDTVVCFTHNNAATHSSLNLKIIGDKCIPTIELNSTTLNQGAKIYTCKSGQIQIDSDLWNKGFMKAEFNFIFDNTENPEQAMYWKGKIYTKINK
ncbi:hypothetical protein [Dysgonomonas sp. 520]|uniref:hypothetical protein n=1 Tax=Dysgonomonas sp. 520 TaxID=2302931 RepID=UPI0013D1CDC8|nr:hypothetical protein [Dysgonomonas sp. 520]NDW09505.1 hypothetical protein [Dysgonomonas sp. 520]